jgi:hypothetical protein
MSREHAEPDRHELLLELKRVIRRPQAYALKIGPHGDPISGLDALPPEPEHDLIIFWREIVASWIDHAGQPKPVELAIAIILILAAKAT